MSSRCSFEVTPIHHPVVCRWIDNYDPEWTPNTTDGQRGRYKFGNQPGVALWNLVRLANAMYPAIGGTVEPIQEALGVYEETMTLEMNDAHRRKVIFLMVIVGGWV